MSLPTPYYEQDGITIYHGDCRDVLPLIEPGSVDLVLTDPPYGVSERTDRKSKGRSNPFAGNSAGPVVLSNDFPPVAGDDAPYDPAPLLRFPRLILFGANYYAHLLPPSASWMVWDKIAGLTSKRAFGFNDNADAELIWTNIGGPLRILSHQWMGLMKDTERSERRVHPTQKPVALMQWIVDRFSKTDDLILDPYMGSGPVARACADTGRRYIGIELEERYCEIAAKRLQQSVLPMFAEAV